MAFGTTTRNRSSATQESVECITEDEWDERYQWLPDEYGDCCLLDEVPNNVSDEFVWTLVDGDHGDGVIVSGRRYVHRIGYIVSVAAPPHSGNTLKSAVCPDMMTDIDSPETTEGSDRSTHISARMSARPQRIEVITRGERRRRWSVEEKQAIVAESLEPNVTITSIARKHGIGTGQLYSWRHQLLTRRSGQAQFARVELISDPPRLAGPGAASSGAIEIVLPNGLIVRVDAQVDEPALRRVLAVLRR